MVQFGGASAGAPPGRVASPAPGRAADALADADVEAGGFARAHISNHRLGHVGTESNLVEAATRVAEADKPGKRSPPPPSVAEAAASRRKPPRGAATRRTHKAR